MSGPAARWDDLLPRILSGLLIAVLGFAAVWAGGMWFVSLTVVVGGVMVWELARMLDPDGKAALMALLAGAALAAAELLPPGLALPVLMAAAMACFALQSRRKATMALYALAILLAAYGLFALRAAHGLIWIGWLMAVVIATDIAGYFAGRIVGGPKFWPRVSPKKTWSGTVAGWVAAGLVGGVFVAYGADGPQLIGISVAASMASQIGDITESAIKRQSGVKDSSQLIPGHGGLFDRFDGMLAASIFLLLVGPAVGFPPTLG